jgi:hypothetical protein
VSGSLEREAQWISLQPELGADEIGMSETLSQHQDGVPDESFHWLFVLGLCRLSRW